MEISKHQTALAENPARNNAGTAVGTTAGTTVGTSVGTSVGATVSSIKSAVPVQERPDMAPGGPGVNILRSTAGAAENANTNSCLSPPRPRARAVRIFKKAGGQADFQKCLTQKARTLHSEAGRLAGRLADFQKSSTKTATTLHRRTDQITVCRSAKWKLVPTAHGDPTICGLCAYSCMRCEYSCMRRAHRSCCQV